jgi:triacylglycerol lipase
MDGMDLGRVPILSRFSARRRPLVAGVLLVVVIVLVGLVAIGVAHRGPAVPTSVDQGRLGTVILVPGYGGSQAALLVLADRLRATGRTTSVVTLPGDGNGDLTQQADALDAAVGLALRNGAPSVDLVGYSAGGVVVRLWIARYRAATAVRRVVTLGSPLHGASIAGVGSTFVPGACPTACQQLVPGSSLLKQLDTVPVPAGLPWLSLWTKVDQTVTPPDSARLAGAVDVEVQDICADSQVQHGQLPTDPLTAGLVLRALGTARLTVPGPADCAPLRALGAP